MALTPKQEKFAQCVADGMSQADAYRAAFDVGEDTKPESIYPEASKLMANHNIATRVQELKDKLVELSLWKRLDSVQTLADIANSGHEATKDRIAAVKELNAMHGWNAPQKIEHSGKLEGGKTLDDFYKDGLSTKSSA